MKSIVRGLCLFAAVSAAACSERFPGSPTSPTTAQTALGQTPPADGSRTLATITGGTGRFANATGTFTMRFTQIGQLIFIGGVLMLITLGSQAVRQFRLRQRIWLWGIAPYAIGAVAALVECLMTFELAVSIMLVNVGSRGVEQVTEQPGIRLEKDAACEST